MNLLPRAAMMIGGAASGKSAFAEQFVTKSGLQHIYIATAQAFDDEMRAKIARHKELRAGQGWRTIEEPVDLPQALATAPKDAAVLVDCATLWLTNLMLSGADIDAASDQLFAQLDQPGGPVVVVTNELGQGVIPDNKMSRAFVQIQGRFNQRLAQHAGLVVQVTAGLPHVLKGQMPGGTP